MPLLGSPTSPDADLTEPVYDELAFDTPEQAENAPEGFRLAPLDYAHEEAVDPDDEGDDTARYEAAQNSEVPRPPLALATATVPAKGAKVVPFRRVLVGRLRKPMVGNDVIAVKRALNHAKCLKWDKFTPVAGPGFTAAVKRFQRRKKLRADGVYGPATHRALAPHFDRYSLRYLWKAKPKASKGKRIREQMRADAYLHYRERGLVDYTQGSWRMSGLNVRYPKIIRAGDCSGIMHAWTKRAGGVNPSGFTGWPALGYTGSMRLHGYRVLGKPEIGDDVHYGPGTGRHVGMFVGYDSSGRPIQIGHGSWRGPSLGLVYYRSDFDHYRSHQARL